LSARDAREPTSGQGAADPLEAIAMNRTLMLAMVTVLAAASSTFAGADCTAHPKEEWLPEAELKKKLEDQGYKIKVFKVDGNCYEIYGWDKEGKKVEIYFDTKDGSIVKQKQH
jgi:hypothetical protein